MFDWVVEYACGKFSKKLGFIITSKITVSRKDKALRKTELCWRYLPWKLSRFWKFILNGAFQNITIKSKRFWRPGLRSLVSPQLIILLQYQDTFLWTCLALAMSWGLLWNIFLKVQVFTINRKELRHTFH